MRITPSGSRRYMKIQTASDHDQFGVDFGSGPETPMGPSTQDGQDNLMETSPEMGSQPSTEKPREGQSDIREYIYRKLVDLGYPPRRLDQYEDEFVNEKIYPGQQREVTVVIPDRYYGSRKRLSDEDFNKVVQEIQDSFGLIFEDAERKDMKITINFMSQGQSQKEEEAEEAAEAEDPLVQVYGPGKDKDRKRRKESKPMNDLLKASHLDLYKRLK